MSDLLVAGVKIVVLKSDVVNTHYGKSMTPTPLFDSAVELADKMFRKYPNKQFLLIYCGMSGVAAATALSYYLEGIGALAGMCYVRKEDERTHGDPIEHSRLTVSDKNILPVFVDDFLCSGNTFAYSVRCVKENILGSSPWDNTNLFSYMKRAKKFWVATFGTEKSGIGVEFSYLHLPSSKGQSC